MITPELPSADCPGSMAPTARQIESLREAGVDTAVVDMRGIPKLKYLQAIPRVRALARSVDLVHAHFGYCGWLAKLQSRVPIVVSFMGDDLLGTPKATGELEWFSRQMVRLNRRLATFADAVIVKSREMAEVIAPVEPDIIPNGVDLRAFQPRDRHTARRQLGLASESRIVLFPGNPHNPRKGHALAAAAVRCASERLGEEIQLLPLWGIRPDQVATYMNACNAMLLTSLIEGSPNVVKEAMACNLPLVAVPVGDVAELLENVPGYAVCPRDANSLGEQLVQTLTSSNAIGGRDAIISKALDLESIAQRVLAVYRKVLGRTSSPATARSAHVKSQAHAISLSQTLVK
jgi:glycosyltransferase involved in cell wall biosynthesis